MVPEQTRERARAVLDACRARGLRVATAELCTGGLVAAALTEIAGSSDVVECGLVAYSNEAKVALLGVPPSLIAAQGAVSEPVARAMAEGALSRAPAADLGVSVTGVAGPGGGTALKPVGLVYIAAARRGGTTLCERRVFPGDRGAVRAASVLLALELLLAQACGG